MRRNGLSTLSVVKESDPVYIYRRWAIRWLSL